MIIETMEVSFDEIDVSLNLKVYSVDVSEPGPVTRTIIAHIYCHVRCVRLERGVYKTYTDTKQPCMSSKTENSIYMYMGLVASCHLTQIYINEVKTLLSEPLFSRLF